MRRPPMPPKSVARVRYEAPAGYELDLEILSLAEFRRRVSPAHLRGPQRVDFHLLLYVTAGRCVHTVDFQSFVCHRGTLLLLSPGQVPQFDSKSANWQGWMVIFRPELFPARPSATDSSDHDAPYSLTDLPLHWALTGSERTAVTEALVRMAADARMHRGAANLQRLLRHQLLALLTRLYVVQDAGMGSPTAVPALLRRFSRYRVAVERDFARLHRVADYARLVGCSQKSLQRASMSVAGISAKAYLSQRVALEAKRLLVHTDQPVSVISDRLGFDEATNFIKFFRRLTGTAPGDFRRTHTPR